MWRLPDCVEISGETYRINTDFRAGIAYAQAAMAGEAISQAALLTLYFPDGIPEDREAAAPLVALPGPAARADQPQLLGAGPIPRSQSERHQR